MDSSLSFILVQELSAMSLGPLTFWLTAIIVFLIDKEQAQLL